MFIEKSPERETSLPAEADITACLMSSGLRMRPERPISLSSLMSVLAEPTGPSSPCMNILFPLELMTTLRVSSMSFRLSSREP
ncbi:MAG: hypothetical protein Q8J64_08825 [Thermodesulfovibrionales bacterium]|nr:hypothetical protein [Thermodesulfovibrionales bacterium]